MDICPTSYVTLRHCRTDRQDMSKFVLHRQTMLRPIKSYHVTANLRFIPIQLIKLSSHAPHFSSLTSHAHRTRERENPILLLLVASSSSSGLAYVRSMPSNSRILEEIYVKFSPNCTENNCSQAQLPPPLASFEGNSTIPDVPIKSRAGPPGLVIPFGSPIIHRKIAIILAVLSVLAACLFLLGYYAVIVRNRRRRRARISHLNPYPGGNEDDSSEDGIHDHHVWYIRTVGLDQSLIDKITICPYKKGDGLFDGGTDCSVCLTEFDEGEFVRLLPKCGHAFHVSCIDTWLRAHVNCPLCRAAIDVSPLITTAVDNNTTTESELTASSPSLSSIQPLPGNDLSSGENPEEEYGGSAITVHPPPSPTASHVLGSVVRVQSDMGRIGFHPCRRSISMDFAAVFLGGRESDRAGNSSCSRFAMEKEKQWCSPKRSYDLGMVRSLSTNCGESKLFVSRIGRGTRSNSSVLRR